jgi:O-antigen/teichoic acid export membrane protein
VPDPRAAGVAQSEKGAREPGEARLLASGAIVQQVAQASGLLVLLVVVTVLARRLSVAELGAYGLVASLAGYLLALRNSIASSTVRAMAGAVEREERSRMFSTAAALYGAVGLATGLVIAAAALAIAGAILEGSLASDARFGGVGLGVVTAVGITATVYLDALRAERQFVRAARTEIVAVSLYLVVMLTLVFAGAGLGVLIAASGAIPLFSGSLCALVAWRARLGFRFSAAGVARRRVMLIVPTAGWLLVVELCNLAMYAFSRVILGAYGTAATVGRFEGPVRAHNLLYALGGALAVPVVPTAARYVATGDDRRLRELVVRGTRYTLALFVPLCVTLIVLAGPILDVWLGQRYGDGGLALAILVSYWLLYGGLVVTPGFLVGAGRAPALARIMLVVAAANLALALVLTPELGLEGPPVATALPFFLAFPFILRLGLRASGARISELAERAWLPNYALGAALALGLLAWRSVAGDDTLVVAGGALGPLVYWLLFDRLVLDSGERELVRGLVSRRGRAR